MNARRTKPGASAPSAVRTPLGIQIYQPTRLDSVCKYTVGSFIAAGAALVAVNVSASSASAAEIGSGFSDSSVGTVSFSDISLTSGGVSDFSTFTPTLSDIAATAIAPEVAPDLLQAAAPVLDQSFDFIPVPDILQVAAPAPEASAVFASSGEVAFAAPDPFVEVPVSTGAPAPAADLRVPAAESPELSSALTDLQPTDGTIEQINPIDVLGLPSGVVTDDPGFPAVLNDSALAGGTDELASVVPDLLLGGGSAFDVAATGSGAVLGEGSAQQVGPIDVLGLPSGVVTDDPGFPAVLNDSALAGGTDELAGVVPDPLLGSDSAFNFTGGSARALEIAAPTDLLGLPNDVLTDSRLFSSLLFDQPSSDALPENFPGTLVASVGDLAGLGITGLADSRAQNDGSRPPVYVPRSDGLPEGSPAQPGGGPVEIFVPPPVSSVIPTDPASPSVQAPGVGSESPTTSTEMVSAEEAATFNWGPAIFTTVGVPFGAYGKTVAGMSQGLERPAAIKDALVRAPISILTDLGLRTALANPIEISEDEGVNRLFTAGLGGGVAAGVDLGVTKYVNPFVSDLAERKVNAASGLYPGTLAALPVVETALQVGANALEEYVGACTPKSGDLATYACNSLISGGITTATWAGGIAEDLKRQEISRVTKENIDCGCSADGALTPEQQAQIQTNYTKVLRNVGIAIGAQSGVTAAIGAPWGAKPDVSSENCATGNGSDPTCFPSANGAPPSAGGDSNGNPPAIPPASGGGAVRADAAVDANSTTATVPACATTCKADYGTAQEPNTTPEFSWSTVKAPPASFGAPPTTDLMWSDVKAPVANFGSPTPENISWSTITAPPANFGSPSPEFSWSTVKAPTTPFVLDSSPAKFGEVVAQPAKVTPAIATPPATVQPQQRKTPDAGTAPLDPFINVPLDAAQQGLKWVFDSGIWGAVKVGEIGGKVISPFFGGWSTQP